MVDKKNLFPVAGEAGSNLGWWCDGWYKYADKSFILKSAELKIEI